MAGDTRVTLAGVTRVTLAGNTRVTLGAPPPPPPVVPPIPVKLGQGIGVRRGSRP